jgi:endonuclease/exonuclease/phosphatase family metal-dependent hydrolase
VTGGVGTSSWQSRTALFTGNHGLFLDSERPLPPAAVRYLDSASGVERGEWCVGIVTRLAVTELSVLELVHLRRDRAQRRLICATLQHETGPLRCFSLHGAHLSHGSIGQYRELMADLRTELDGDPRAIFGGDLNCWGFVARRVLRGWRQAARGASWPSWRPHSQVDHLFVRGDVKVLDSAVVDCRDSDHRPVVATVSLS